ncbi:MAG: alpha/beta hydrolase [Candidatus Methylomirabilales bacterium]
MNAHHPEPEIPRDAVQKRRRRRRRLILALGIVGLLGSTVVLSWNHMVSQGTRSALFDRKGDLISALPLPAAPPSPERAQDLLLTSSTGLTAKVRLLSSAEGKLLPGVILLDGIKQGRRVVDYPAIEEINKHAVVMSMDYPLVWGKKFSGWDILPALVTFRQAALDSVSSVLLMVDYLESRPDVDKDRIILVGTSFGAPVAVIAGAIDYRPSAVAVLYGGGKLGDLITHNLRRSGRLGRTAIPRPAAGFFGRAIAAALTPLEPTRYAPLIAPRPLLLISGADDELIPRDSVLALYRAARPPKDLWWIHSKHLRPKQQDLMRTLIRQLNQWFQRKHLL